VIGRGRIGLDWNNPYIRIKKKLFSAVPVDEVCTSDLERKLWVKKCG